MVPRRLKSARATEVREHNARRLADLYGIDSPVCCAKPMYSCSGSHIGAAADDCEAAHCYRRKNSIRPSLGPLSRRGSPFRRRATSNGSRPHPHHGVVNRPHLFELALEPLVQGQIDAPFVSAIDHEARQHLERGLDASSGDWARGRLLHDGPHTPVRLRIEARTTGPPRVVIFRYVQQKN